MSNKQNPNFYAVIPAIVRYDKDLKANEKLIYGEISALSNKNGYCNASNAYFSELFDVTKQTVSGWINNLKELGFITVEIIKDENNRVKYRHLYLPYNYRGVLRKKEIPPSGKIGEGIKENPKGNNTSNNNTSNNTKKNIIKKRFSKPSVSEVKEYCEERGNGIDPEKFWDYYESKNWKVGRSPMKDWRAAVRTWEKNQKNYKKSSGKKSNKKHVKYSDRVYEH